MFQFFGSKNPAYVAAHAAGAQAAQQGQPLEANPEVFFGMKQAWLEGYAAAQKKEA